MNPLLVDVAAAFAHVPTRPTAVTVNRTGVALLAGGHFQGVQRTGPTRLVITSSSHTDAYAVVCEMANGTHGRALAPVTLARLPMKHAGGFQSVGSHLVVGVEDDAAKNVSQIQFWDFAHAPRRLAAPTIRRSGAVGVSTTAAVGVTSHRGGALLAVATWDAATIDFYASPADPFTTPAARFARGRTWVAAHADRRSWVDENWGRYQAVNLMTQRDGSLYLVGFNRNNDDEDWMDLYSLDVDAPGPRMLTKIGKQHMFCTAGCSFAHAAGIHIVSSTRFDVYAANGFSGDHETGTTIHLNHFAEPPPT